MHKPAEAIKQWLRTEEWSLGKDWRVAGAAERLDDPDGDWSGVDPERMVVIDCMDGGPGAIVTTRHYAEAAADYCTRVHEAAGNVPGVDINRLFQHTLPQWLHIAETNRLDKLVKLN